MHMQEGIYIYKTVGQMISDIIRTKNKKCTNQKYKKAN